MGAGKKVAIFGRWYLIALCFFTYGVGVGSYKIFPWGLMESIHAEIYTYFTYKDEPMKPIRYQIIFDRLERPAKYNTKGFKLHDLDFNDTGYLLISRYSKELGESIIELFSISEEKVIHSWIPPFEEIAVSSPKFAAGELATNNGVKVDNNRKDIYRPMHPLLLNDGSIVFNITQGPLVRIDACGSLIWVIDRQFHHSIELDHLGNIVAPIVVEGSKYFSLKDYRDDGFAVVSPEGMIMQEYSITEILQKNGYTGLVFGVGRVEDDRIHLNDAQPMLNSSDGVEIGDIALSNRNISTVFLFRPRTEEVVWLKTGPWLKQHDVNLLEGGKFSIFGNNVIDTSDQGTFLIEEGKSEIYIFNPLSNEINRPFSKMMSKHKIASISEGRAKILKNGDAYIEQTNSSRLLRISNNSVRWEYVNSISPKSVGFVHWSRYIYGDQIDLKWMEDLKCN